jgi:dihydrofolate reductase/uncharacterized protein YndB with AHSA1/START domain
MRKLIVFNNLSLDGYFTDRNGDMSWAHNPDAEWRAFTRENAGSGGELVFGRKTYDLMVSFWPTPQAAQLMPEVAAAMNASPKVVFSRTMKEASWNNTRLVNEDIAAAARELKEEPGPNLVIMGSGSIVSQLAPAGLIDAYQIVVHPLVLGAGTTLFEGLKKKCPLTLTGTRTFGNGNVLLCYEPTSADREIVSARVFNVPCEQLFQAWSDPARLARWWGPEGFTNTFHEFDLRPGGNWRFIMHSPDGTDYPNHSIFIGVAPGERIVYRHVSAPAFQMTATFDDLGGATRLTWRMLFESAEQCEKMKSVCVPANEQNFDRLEAELARMT